MKGFRPLTMLAVGAALVAFPAGAGAAPKVSDVRAAVKQANASLEQAADAASAGNPGRLRSAIVRLGNHARRSDQLARKVRRIAAGDGERVHAAKSLVAVGGQYDRIVGEFATLLDEIEVDVQPLIAQALALSADAQGRIMTMLVKLAEQLPEPVAATVIGAIERFQTDGDLEALVNALAGDEVIAAAKDILAEQLDSMFADLELIVDRLGEIDPELAGLVGGVLDSLHETIGQVNDLIAGLFDGLLGGILPFGSRSG